MGFSAGAALALTAFMRGNESTGGVASLSGYLPMPLEYPAQMSAVNNGKRVWMVHSKQDRLVDIELVRFMNTSLNALGRPTTLVEWSDVPHELTPREVEAATKAATFLQNEALGPDSRGTCPAVAGTNVLPISWRLR